MTELKTFTAMKSRHAGADWIRSAFEGVALSPLGENVANLLGDVFCGIYHLDTKQLGKTKWGDNHSITVRLHYQSLSTFDDEYLTRLVVFAHDRMLRVSIGAVAPKLLELMFHQRHTRTGGVWERMPTMEQHLAAHRLYYRAVDDQEPEKHP